MSCCSCKSGKGPFRFIRIEREENSRKEEGEEEEEKGGIGGKKEAELYIFCLDSFQGKHLRATDWNTQINNEKIASDPLFTGILK